MFDFTKEISLEKENSKLYNYLRLSLYILAFAVAVYFLYLTLFPTAEFSFSFLAPTSGKNSFLNPRDAKGNLISTGEIKENTNTYFDAALLGSFSKIALNFSLNKNSSNFQNGMVEIRKAYKAFLYPEGKPVGFKDGSLIKNNSDYYLVSNGKLQKFQNEKIVSTLGFTKEAFIEVNNEELKYNEIGDEITDPNHYPDFSLFKIDNIYYRIKDQILQKFVSPQAYLTQYNENQAISKDKDFLNNFTRDDNLIGFSDGTLVAYGISGFIVSGTDIIPISNAETFIGQGFNWDDLKNINGDEFSLYQSATKHFTNSSPHPDGTIFFTNDTNKWYMIRDGQKHKLSSDKIAYTWLKGRNPISVSSKNLEVLAVCGLEKGFWRSANCDINIPLEKAQELPGIDYEFHLKSQNDVRLENLDILFEQNLTRDNLRISISSLINKIKLNYGIQQ